MLIWNKYYQFRIGAELTSVSLSAWFGWVGFMWLWKKEANMLDGLPMMQMGPCLSCGSTEWTSANTTQDGKGFTDCNRCKGYPGGPR